MFQSTHSRGVRRDAFMLANSGYKVSIHALTRSATVDRPVCVMQPTFQSTHSRGVRHSPSRSILCLPTVSIHALTRSATCFIVKHNLYKLCFNPRTHEECDCKACFSFSISSRFNPRTHEECDPELYVLSCPCLVSIHALTRSATQLPRC